MIFKISQGFTDNCPPQILSEICSNAVKHRHYMIVDAHVRQKIRASIVKHGSTLQKELFIKYKGFAPTVELQNYLTVIDVDANYSQRDFSYLVEAKAVLLVENSHNEWNLYKELTTIYYQSRKYGNLFKLLSELQQKQLIIPINGGGYRQMPVMVGDFVKDSKRGNLSLMKIMTLFDRDTDNSTYYDGNKKALFRFFSGGKDHTTIVETDIYTLRQSPYIWHMWYKRAIENYFPDEQYVNCGVNVTILNTCPDRNYFKFDDGTPKGYAKAKLSSLVDKLTFSDFENGQKHFTINGKDTSEFELFLLKMLRII